MIKNLKAKHPNDLYVKYLKEKEECDKEKEDGPSDVKRSRLVNVDITAEEIKSACVEMATKDGRPFATFKDSGLRKILDPLLDALPKNHKITVSPETVQDEVRLEAEKVRNHIKEELKEVSF